MNPEFYRVPALSGPYLAIVEYWKWDMERAHEVSRFRSFRNIGDESTLSLVVI